MRKIGKQGYCTPCMGFRTLAYGLKRRGLHPDWSDYQWRVLAITASQVACLREKGLLPDIGVLARQRAAGQKARKYTQYANNFLKGK